MRRERIAERALLIEEFLVREARGGKASARRSIRCRERRALVHGHCHQKAFDAAGAVRHRPALDPGLAVEPIESSCCGMAGSVRLCRRSLRRVDARWPSFRCCLPFAGRRTTR